MTDETTTPAPDSADGVKSDLTPDPPAEPTPAKRSRRKKADELPESETGLYAVYDNQLLRYASAPVEGKDVVQGVRDKIVAEAKQLQDVDPADRFTVRAV